MTKSAEIEVTKWAGVNNYQCPFCPHATTESKVVMQAHIVGSHPNQLREAELEKMTAAATKDTGGVLGGAPSTDEGKK